MFIINNKGKGGELINGNQGELHFCKLGCENYETCDHNKCRVLKCNRDIMEYAFQIESGFKMYVWEGNWQQQPIWWFELLKICQSYIAEIRNK